VGTNEENNKTEDREGKDGKGRSNSKGENYGKSRQGNHAIDEGRCEVNDSKRENDHEGEGGDTNGKSNNDHYEGQGKNRNNSKSNDNDHEGECKNANSKSNDNNEGEHEGENMNSKSNDYDREGKGESNNGHDNDYVNGNNHNLDAGAEGEGEGNNVDEGGGNNNHDKGEGLSMITKNTTNKYSKPTASSVGAKSKLAESANAITAGRGKVSFMYMYLVIDPDAEIRGDDHAVVRIGQNGLYI
jgi:hypothetical protein